MAASDLDYIHVVQRLAATVGDTEIDEDDYPDITPVTEGTITIVPTLTNARAQIDGEWQALYNAPIVCDVDTEGYLTYNGKRGVWLVDLGSAKVTPAVPRDKAAYTITYTNMKFGGSSFKVAPVSINPDPDDGDCDLTTAALLPLPSGMTLDQIQAIAADAIAARQAAQDAVAAVQKDQPGGIAGLDANGVVSVARIPDLAENYAALVPLSGLQAALDALPAYSVGDPKRHIRVAAGEITVSTAFKVPSGVVLDLTQGCRIHLADASNCDIITNADWAAGGSDIEIIGGHLDGNRTAQTSTVGDGPGQSLITLVNVARFRVSGVQGTSSFLHGVDMNVRDLAANSFGDPGCSDGIVENCRFTDFGDDGISPHWSGGISIVACENYGSAGSYSTSSNGIECDDGSHDITITGCVSHDVVNGVMVQGHSGRIPSRRVTITGQISYNCSRAGVMIAQPTSTNADEPGRGVYVNGLVVRDSYIGVQIENYRSAIIKGLHLENVTNAVYVNESVSGACSNIDISGGEMLGVLGNKVVYGGTASAAKVKVDVAGGPFSDTIWLPAERLLPQSGTPNLLPVGPAGREMTCWMFDPDTDESVHVIVPIPSTWQWISADVWWINPATGTPATKVAWQINRSPVSPGSTVASESAGAVLASPAAAQNVINSAANALINTPIDPTQMLRLEIVRAASNANDTYTTDAALLGVMVRRVK